MIVLSPGLWTRPYAGGGDDGGGGGGSSGFGDPNMATASMMSGPEGSVPDAAAGFGPTEAAAAESIGKAGRVGLDNVVAGGLLGALGMAPGVGALSGTVGRFGAGPNYGLNTEEATLVDVLSNSPPPGVVDKGASIGMNPVDVQNAMNSFTDGRMQEHQGIIDSHGVNPYAGTGSMMGAAPGQRPGWNGQITGDSLSQRQRGWNHNAR